MQRILFVCHGNICRSPMAEFVMKDMVAKAGLSDKFYVNSVAASREEEGNFLYPPARRELEKHGVPYERKRARLITRQDVEEYDRIYYMDSRNLRYLRQLFPGETKFRPLLFRDNMNFMLPVPLASLLAVEICSETSAAAKISSALDTR